MKVKRYFKSLLLLLVAVPAVKIMDFNCSTDSMLLYSNTNFSRANDKMVMEMQQKCINDINNKTNDVCSSSNPSNETEIHWNLIFTWPTVEVDELTKQWKRYVRKSVEQSSSHRFKLAFLGSTILITPRYTVWSSSLSIRPCRNFLIFYGLNVYNFTMYDIGTNS